ncbi:protein phosphatase 1 regulatory subunit 12A-like isoform X10 [Haliotis rubra]|uniref:protein phosphatase 1 regulatory subunit 12A-like isoform X10 n=1 Tax=Haliotis rubra TaxID=36100 RepID=UPI001EE5AFA9|nr:protein phosphatase 1 regulatory subunit 12A-like isoform X10 [Haliotis rubra]
MAEEKQVNAMFRRHEQLKRWEDSETNREPGSPKLKPRKVQFQDGCIFLAACSSGDREEVTRLLERGADINTANVDGLTALHQACIDDNLEMVEFLVEKVADVDVCDNEGWTPLHATASCGFTEIARYLIKMGANIAAVNNDGDLPIDICEDEEMENLLQAELDKQGIDADEARKEEENRMLADANQWLNSRIIKEKKHAKTGATALHVAAAKGYVTVLKVLLQAGVDINAEDNDGWTPLHAAAHWAQCEACQLLVEQLCDMEKKNTAGQSALDVADEDMKKFLEDLKKKQVLLRSRAEEMNEDIIQTKGPPNKRRSSVTRMSGDQKQNVLHKTSEQERVALETNKIIKRDSDKIDSSGSEGEGSTETERQNEINKQTSQTDKGLKISTNHKSRDNDYSAWRAGLRKTGSTSMVHERMSKENEDDRSLPRSASSPRLAFDQRIEDDRNGTRRSSQGTTAVSSPDKGDSKVTDRHSHTGSMDQSRSPYRSLSSYNSSGFTYHSQYEPYYRRMNDRTSRRDGQDYQDRIISRTPSIVSTVTTTTGPVSTTTVSTTSVSSATTTVTSPTTPTSTNSVFRRSYEPPKRDEETETQRKARAKRARETRRSTQGVSLEDIEKAEETLRNSSTDKDREKLRLSQKDVTDSASTESRDVPRDSGRDSNRTSSSLSSKDTSSEDTSYRRRNLEDRHEDDTRSSFRRSRDQPRDLSSSSSQYSSDNSTSAYIPRSQRNALSTSDTNTTTSLTGSSGLARTSSYRSRLRNGEVSSREEEQKTAKEEPKKDESKKADHEEKKESSALQKRRAWRERRSTGIVTYTPDDEEDEKGKENKPEEEKKDEYGVHGLLDPSRYLHSTLGSRYGSSRYSSSTDMTPTDRYRDRPSSYSEYSRSTPSALDSDYKKLYEDEKSENERLRRELEQTKRELRDAKTELDKMMRKHTDAARAQLRPTTRGKREHWREKCQSWRKNSRKWTALRTITFASERKTEP